MDIFIIILLAVFIAALVYCGTLMKKLVNLDSEADYREAFDELISWADIFVRAVRDSKKEATGEEKRALAVKYIKEVCANLDLQLSDEQLENIIRAAYVDMTAFDDDSIVIEQDITIEEDDEDSPPLRTEETTPTDEGTPLQFDDEDDDPIEDSV